MKDDYFSILNKNLSLHPKKMSIFKISRLIILFFSIILTIIKIKKKKIGVICINHGFNIGNSLIKYAMTIKIYEFGYIPYMIATNNRHRNISFLKKNTNCVIIKKNFTEIQKGEYDVLMVNSDQTWRRFDSHFYDIGFLKFAEKWNTPKFAYGASLGYNYWKFSKEDENIAKNLLKNFSGISVREQGSINLIKNHLGIKPILVIDPTLLIDKKYYLKIINNFNNKKITKDKYIFTYIFRKERNTQNFVKYASKKLGYKVYNVKLGDRDSVENFIYGIANCKAVITNSYHGTIFSIIFKKPFISFIIKNSAKERFISLKETFKIKNRIVEYNQFPDINLLTTPLNINYKLINNLKIKSNIFLKKNLRTF